MVTAPAALITTAHAAAAPAVGSAAASANRDERPLPQAPGTGLDPKDFYRANRIQVQDGSLFIDPYLVIHPRELAPANENALREKMRLTYSINNPSFYEGADRASIALNLGQLVPVSLKARRAQLMEQVRQFNTQVEQGSDAALTGQVDDRRKPFGAILRDTIGDPKVDPAALELLKNGLALYLLMREKLTQQGYYGRLTDYVKTSRTTDQVLGELAARTGLSPLQVREAALKNGIDGVGALLGLPADYIREVKEVADYAATQDFGHNLIEHWHLGRQLVKPQASLQEKMAAGMEHRIENSIKQFRQRVRHHYDVPLPVHAIERRIAGSLELVEPIQRKLLYALGYELCYSPKMTADDIAFHRGIYGLHRKAANDLRDIRGTYRIYFSGKGDLEGSMRTLCHEIAHNLWPAEFSAKQVDEIDQLLNADTARFERLQQVLLDPEKFTEFERLLGAYHAGDAREKRAIIATADDLFADKGIRVDQLFPVLRNAFELRHLVAYAQDRLHIEGEMYSKSGYNTPQERFREVLSRYAELRQVRLRNQPEILNFIAPDLDRIWKDYYIPHLERMYDKVRAYENAPQAVQEARPAPVKSEVPAPEPTGARPLPTTPQPEPKVQQQPETPAAVAACHAEDGGTPSNQVQAGNIQITPAIAGARQALHDMHVHCGI